MSEPRKLNADISVGDGTRPSCAVTSIVDDLSSPAPPNPESTRLADHTTFRLGGPARRWIVARTEQELVEAVRETDERGEKLLVLSGGSNMLVSDDEFDGTVVQVATSGLSADVSGCGGAVATIEAGEVWDDVVAYAIDQEWSGIEALSGIPGLVGTTPVQNVGAYGADVSQVCYRVRTFDRKTAEYRTFAAADCQFAYRDSVFKRERLGDSPTGRYVICQVWLQFLLGSLSAPIRYAELARVLGVNVGDRVPSRDVRQAVLEIRGGKGMVPDAADHDTWSAGSFFTNPILDAELAAALPEDAPRFPASDGRVKTSAAWLIDHAGFGKGFAVRPNAPASLSTKHALALTNRGDASADDVVELARALRDGVEQRFGVRLVPEPVLVGLSLD